MYTIEPVSDRQMMENIVKSITLPSRLSHFPEECNYQYIFSAVKNDNEYVGIAYGVIEYKSEVFFLNYVYLKEEFRKYNIIIGLLEHILENSINVAKAQGALWKYNIEQNERDVRPILIDEISFCNIKNIKKMIHCGVEMEMFNNKVNPFFEKFQPWLIKEHMVVEWDKCEDTIKDKIRMREKHLQDEDYLSPFVDRENDKSVILDGRISFILFNREQEVLGWIICVKTSEKVAMIKRFYVYPEKRRGQLSPAFAAYALNRIGKFYEYLHFYIEHGNKQMERFANYFCKDVLKVKRTICDLEITFNKKVYSGAISSKHIFKFESHSAI